MRLINFRDLMVSYEKDRSLNFVKTYGINYKEELYQLLKSVCDVDREKVDSLCDLPSLENSKKDLSYEVYEISVLGGEHEYSTMKIKDYIDSVIEKFSSDELNYEQVYNLIKREPVAFPNLKQEFYAFMAAYLELKLRGTGIEIPKWIDDRFYSLSSPYFENDKSVEIIISAENSFSKRNYYCSIR